MKKIGEIDTKTTEEVKAWATDNLWTCPECGSSETQYSLQVIPSGRTDNWFPKYVTQIKENCKECGRYRRFAPQNDLLIKRFNNRFKNILLEVKENDNE